MNNSTRALPEHQFLLDEPIQDDKYLKFGHRELGAVLVDIISKCRTPFTIRQFRAAVPGTEHLIIETPKLF
ncbi:MAG TPA: hypothetical protein ENH41_05275 [Candidatus Omnitrophica bacterium]|nr:hypothetical protein [Candidatus Omnitrophota bacterium]